MFIISYFEKTTLDIGKKSGDMMSLKHAQKTYTTESKSLVQLS